MLTQEQVLEIWEGKRSLMKPHYTVAGWKWNGRWIDKAQKHELPELWPGYNRAVKEKEIISPHVEHGFFPERLFKERAPNQSDEELAYMRANFKQVTLPVYKDCQNTILRALHENNWTIDYAPNSEEDSGVAIEFKEYVTEGVEVFGSVLNYVKFIVPKVYTLDSMGLISVLPKYISTVTQEVDGDAVEVIDPDTQLEPVPQYISVDKVWGFQYGKWYLWLTEEKSMVKRGNEEAKEGIVLLLVDEVNVWRIEQTGEKYKFEFNITLWWEHGRGYPLATHLKGDPVLRDGSACWQSYYLTACEPLDIVLLDTSYLQASKAHCVFPHMIQLGDDCEFIDPEHGAACGGSGKLRWWEPDGEAGALKEHWKTCPACKGQRLVARMGPQGKLLVRPGDRNSDGRTEIPNVSEALSFVGPDVSTLAFLRKEIEANTTDGRAILHLSTETQAVQDGSGTDVKTATQSGIDLRATYAFVKPISDRIFDIYYFILKGIGDIRYGDNFKGVSLTRPTSFDMKTEDDYMRELEQARLANLDPSAIWKLEWQWVKARFQHDPEAEAVFSIITAADDLFSLSEQTIQSQLTQRVIEPWQVILHTQKVSIYEEIAREGTLKRADDVKLWKAEMQKVAKSRVPKPVVSPAMEKLQMAIAK